VTPTARRPVVAVVVLVALVAGGCRAGGSDDGAAPDPSTTPSTTPSSSAAPETLPSRPTVEDLTQLAGCEGIRRFDALPAPGPIRGGAATEGAACTVEGIEAHLFVRASTEPPPPGSLDFPEGGTVENIDRVVGTGVDGGCRSWVAVGETWFALAEERDVLERIAEALGGAVREVLPTGPPASYGPPGCPEG
jgi:hypothetical protein